MKKKTRTAKTAKAAQAVDQPRPFTPGITRAMVRQHAYQMFRDRLPEHRLTLEDWVLAEKDLAATLDTDEVAH